MYLIFRKRTLLTALSIVLTLSMLLFVLTLSGSGSAVSVAETENSEKKYIKWVDFNVTTEAMRQAMEYDIASQKEANQIDWISLLAYAATQNGGNFSSKRNSSIDKLAARLKAGEKIEDITRDMKYYAYYYEAYSAVLSGFVGEYFAESYDEEADDKISVTRQYGLMAYSPVASGYGYSHSDDFGVSRSYGFQRRHLGNDLIGSVGTPIIAVEGGTVEAMGWNRYGGWRVGIRSHDGKRYYYYAHLRKNHPYHSALSEGAEVKAGDVIGYLGMTGYSDKENVNGMTIPHLHFGMQLIFDESQKDGNNEIWIDVYQIVKLLSAHRSRVFKDEATKDYNRLYDIYIKNS